MYASCMLSRVFSYKYNRIYKRSLSNVEILLFTESLILKERDIFLYEFFAIYRQLQLILISCQLFRVY